MNKNMKSNKFTGLKKRAVALALALTFATGLTTTGVITNAPAVITEAAQSSYFKTSGTYAQNGYHVNSFDTSKSNVLLIGDSRICNLSNFCPKAMSYNSTWSGHYWNNSTHNLNITSSTRVSEMKTQIQNIFNSDKNNKSCIIVIEPTINDWSGATSEVNNIIALRKELKKVTGGSVKTYVTSMVGYSPSNRKTADNYKKSQSTIDSINKALKKEFGSDRYIDLGSPSTFDKNSWYDTDGLHFTKEGAAHVRDAIWNITGKGK